PGGRRRVMRREKAHGGTGGPRARRGHGLPIHRHSRARPRSIDRVLHEVLGMRVTWRMRIRETGGGIAVLKSPRGSQRLEPNWYPPRGRYRAYRQGDELDHLAFTVPDVDVFLREHRGDLRGVMKAFAEGKDRPANVTVRRGRLDRAHI